MMMRTLIYLFLIFSICTSTNLEAQSPYELKWKQEVPIIAGGLGLLTAGVIKGVNTIPLTEEEILNLNPNNVNSFDRSATNNWSINAQKKSDYLLHGSYALSALVLTKKQVRRDFFKLGIIFFETAVITQGITGSTKAWSGRIRPFVYNPNADWEEKMRRSAKFSFISGHTSTTAMMCFFTAKVVTDYFPDTKLKPFIWTGAILIPAATAFYRYRGGKHFPTDVMAGYAVGALVGYFIPHLHKKDRKNKNMMLGTGADGMSIGLVWKVN